MTDPGQLSPLKQAFLAIEALQARCDAAERAHHEPIAIVGIGCRLPGADSPAELWRLLADGRDAVVDAPPERWDPRLLDPDPDAPGRMYTRRGGFIADVDRFDAAFFNISPREAASLDPQQRLLLEVAWAALEDAAISPPALAGSATGVFVGIGANDYQLLGAGGRLDDPYVATGNAFSVAAGRLAYVLDLRGPCVALDTACSSSLVAVHLACQSLRAGECNLALAGGVNLMLAPEVTVSLCKLRALSPTGRCHTFAAAADGYVRGEGCGVVALKTLSRAIADGDPIWAEIRGSAINHDGRSNGLTAPSRAAQIAVIRAALAAAEVRPADVALVEAHGTGTPLGDPIELGALATVFAERPHDRPLRVGSIKTNIGHLEPAAGIAGIIKAALAVHHRQIPAHLHFDRPTPHADLRGLRVPVTHEPWPAGPVLAGVSAFGLSGTNAHAVLAAPSTWPEGQADIRPAPPPPSTCPEGQPDDLHLLPVAAASEPALRALAARLADHLAARPEQPLADIVHTATLGRAPLAHRLAAVAADPRALADALRSYARDGEAEGVWSGVAALERRPRVAFLYTGQGSLYPGMARELLARPPFRAALERCDAVLRPWLARPLFELLNDPAAPLADTAFTQPITLALAIATTELWRSLGVEPDMTLGHSVGEYAAAWAAGVFDHDDVLRLVAERGRLMQALPRGAMTAVFAAVAVVRPAIAAHPDVAIAAINGPSETVISGPADELAAIAATLTAAGHRCRPLAVSHAFHAPATDPMLAALERAVAAVPRRPPRIPVLSNLTGAPAGDALVDPTYWRRHAREPVRFADDCAALRALAPGALVEVGPRPTLLALVHRCLPDLEIPALASLREGRHAWAQMLESLARLHVAGARVDLSAARTALTPPRRLRLPTYPFERTRHWYAAPDLSPATPDDDLPPATPDDLPRGTPDADLSRTLATNLSRGTPAHDLSQGTLKSDLSPGTPPAPAPNLSPGTPVPPWGDLAALAPGPRLALLTTNIRREAARVLRWPGSLDPARGFFELGMDSLMAVELRRRIEAGLGRRISPTATFDHPTVAALARHLADADLPQPIPAALPAAREPIAIIGLACRFPGGANDPEAYWRLLAASRDGTVEVPRERWDLDAFHDPDPDAPGKTYTRRGGFLQDVDVAGFDAAFFNISPREAAAMDPQQRLLLEVAWEALERAGQPADRLAGSATGVYVGVTLGDYAAIAQAGGLEAVDMYAGTGNTFNVLAGRVSFALGLQGPNLPVDTACSSSLVAVHLACQALRAGECERALAGGVNLMLSPGADVMYARMRATAPDGRCKAFDAAADGLVRGEGCGVLVLRRLADALRDGDPVLAVIHGTAVNHDGRSSGLTVPNGGAQQAVIRRALADAGREPAAVDYVEAHGTGTPLGDPIELHALAAALAPGRTAPLVVGSVKTNIGHLEAAAGVAALAKVVLALQHAQIPANLHFTRLNPAVDVADFPLELPISPRPWPAAGRPRLAGVSAFGISGTNAHVILGEPPPPPPSTSPPPTRAVLPLSARTPAALHALAEAWRGHLAAHPDLDLRDVLHTAARRSHLEHRLAVTGRDLPALTAGLAAFLDDAPSPARSPAADRVVFVFPGQGGQHPGMIRDLLAEPVFADIFKNCDAAARTHGVPLLDLVRGADPAWTAAIALCQPALCALQIALAGLWRAWGVEPAAVVGHSLGEVAAACVAGALTIPEAMQIACTRSRLMDTMSGDTHGMLLVELPRAAAAAEIAAYPDLAIAACNAPRTTVLSGPLASLHRVLATLQQQGRFCRIVNVPLAAHHASLDPLLPGLRAALAELRPQPPRIPLWSSLLGEQLESTAQDADYWCRNFRHEVRFAAVTAGLIAAGHTTFLELSPHPTLQLAVDQLLTDAAVADGLALAPLQRDHDDGDQLRAALATLYTRGYPLDWRHLYPHGRVLADLPTYPWQRRRHWVDPPPAAPPGGHPLLGVHTRLLRPPGQQVWDTTLDPRRFPLLADHDVAGGPAIPLSVWLALAATAAATCDPPLALVDAAQDDALAGPAAPLSAQLLLLPEGPGAWTWEIHARAGDAPFTRVALGRAAPLVASPTLPDSLAAIHARCTAPAPPMPRDPRRGPGLQVLSDMSFGTSEALAAVRLPAAEARGPWRLHPAHLEAGAALLAALIGADDPRIPLAAARVIVHAGPAAVRWCHLVRTGPDRGDLRLLDAAGATLAEVVGLRLGPPAWALARPGISARLTDWLYQIDWRPQPRGPARAPAPSGWLLLADAAGVTAALARRLDPHVPAVHVRPGRADDGLDPADPLSLRTWLAGQLPALGPDPAVVLAWPLDIPDAPDLPVARLAAAQTLACVALLHLVQALRALGAAARVWVVTRRAQPAAAGDPVNPAAAPVWGLARTVALEHPDLWGGLVDLDDAPPAAAAESLLAEISAADADDHLAFRTGERRVARLVRADPPEIPARPLTPVADATYLISGGLGGVGLELARWLAARGARQLVVTGRRELPPRSTWDSLPADHPARDRVAAVRTIEALGATVTLFTGDIADPAAVDALFAALRPLPPLRGVLHAAGISEHTDTLHLDAATLTAVLRPKLDGAWLLHRATAGLPLDFFVMFSSAAAAWGSAFAGAYGAANHFLDALAHARRRAGLCGLAIAWGGWASGGMVTAAAEHYFTQIGLGLMPPDHALQALEVLLAADVAHRVVSPVDWTIFKPVYEARRERPLLAEISVTTRATSARSDLRTALAAAPHARRELLVDHVRLTVAAVLRCDPADVAADHGFFQLGLDSLMSVQLRNRLQDDLGAPVPTTAVFEHPTSQRLAAHLLTIVPGLAPEPPPEPQSPEPPPQDPPPTTASEADLLAELARELDDLAALTDDFIN